MPRRPFKLAAGAVLLLTPAFVFGCGDASDGDATVTTSVPTRAATIPVSPSGSSTVAGVQAPDGDYDKYVGVVCEATADFQDGLADFADADFARKVLDKPDEAFNDVADVFEQYSEDLKKADAPTELEAWQEDAEERIDATAAALKNKDQNQLSRIFDDQLPDLPSGAESRLREAAKDNSECSKANLFR